MDVNSDPGPSTMRSALRGWPRAQAGRASIAPLAAQPHALERRARMAGDGLALQLAAVARARHQRHAVERGGIHVPLRVEQPLADAYGLGERPEASSSAESMRLPSVWLRANEKRYLNARVSGSFGSAAKAAMHLRTSPGGVTFGLLAQDAGGPAVVGHGHHGARLQPHGQERADGHGRARAAADDDGALPLAGRGAGAAGRSAANAAVAEGSWVNGLRKGATETPGTPLAGRRVRSGAVAEGRRAAFAAGCSRRRLRRASGRGAPRSRDSPSPSGTRPSTRPAPRCGAGRPCSPRRWPAAACPRPRSPGMTQSSSARHRFSNSSVSARYIT